MNPIKCLESIYGCNKNTPLVKSVIYIGQPQSYFKGYCRVCFKENNFCEECNNFIASHNVDVFNKKHKSVTKNEYM